MMTARCGGEVKHFIITTMFYQVQSGAAEIGGQGGQ